MKKHFAASGRRSFFHLAAAAAVTLSSVAAVQAAQPGAEVCRCPGPVFFKLPGGIVIGCGRGGKAQSGNALLYLLL